MRYGICCLALAAIIVAGCGGDDDGGAGCVFDPIDELSTCRDLATELGCDKFSFNPDTQTCHTEGCVFCSPDKVCEYAFADVPSDDDCDELAREFDCVNVAYDAGAAECVIGACTMCDDAG